MNIQEVHILWGVSNETLKLTPTAAPDQDVFPVIYFESKDLEKAWADNPSQTPFGNRVVSGSKSLFADLKLQQFRSWLGRHMSHLC